MNENEQIEKIESEDQDLAKMYAEKMAEMEKNYVPKSKLDQSIEREKTLMNAILKGEKLEVPKEEKVDIEALRNDLYGKDCGKLNSYEYIDKTLKLRKSLMEAGERDPFLPVGDQTAVTSAIIESSDRVAACLQDMLDFAQGDEGIFLAEYQRRVTDPKLPIGNRNKRK